MTDASGNESPSGDSSAQDKARLRRERRAAKIAAGGANRLKAITQLQGGTHRDVEKDVPGGTSDFHLIRALPC
jgi:GET complex subunit GET2